MKALAKNVLIDQEWKLWGSKMMRYRLSLNHELCHLEIGGRGHQSKRLLQHLLGIHSWGSGGNMVTRLKLKGIDGRAPPGVEPAA